MCQGFTTREETTGYEGLHCEYKYFHRSRRTFGWLSTSGEIKLSTSIHMEDHQKSYMFYHFLKKLYKVSIIQNVYRVHGAKYVECGVSTSFTSSTKD